jgi:hypothetical protein
LIIPVEEQSRELDAKLLLASVAAERGFQVIVGSRHEIHLQAARLPAGIYYAKSFRPISLKMFDILCGLGFEIVACDEEGCSPIPTISISSAGFRPKPWHGFPTSSPGARTMQTDSGVTPTSTGPRSTSQEIRAPICFGPSFALGTQRTSIGCAAATASSC